MRSGGIIAVGLAVDRVVLHGVAWTTFTVCLFRPNLKHTVCRRSGLDWSLACSTPSGPIFDVFCPPVGTPSDRNASCGIQLCHLTAALPVWRSRVRILYDVTRKMGLLKILGMAWLWSRLVDCSLSFWVFGCVLRRFLPQMDKVVRVILP